MRVAAAVGKPLLPVRHIKSTALATALCVFSSDVNADEVITVERDGYSILHMASLPEQGVAEVDRKVAQAISNVGAWISQAGDWEGLQTDVDVRVLIDPDKYTPTQIRTTIFVPENRVRQALDQGDIASADLGIVHEVTHVLAVSAYRRDRNRFYDDGLAVYLQHRFGPSSNYPTFGDDVHIALAKAVTKVGAFLALADADEVRRSKESLPRQLGYLTVGSFTQFLIETYGVSAYFRIYSGESLETVTGSTRDELERRWRDLVTSFQESSKLGA